MTKPYHSSGKDDWETPPALFTCLDVQFHFTLDVCATAANAKCNRYFAPRGYLLAESDPCCAGVDGLVRDWSGGTCWMNPPYSRSNEWVAKAVEECKTIGTRVVALIAARTDTRAWHNWVWPHATEIRFLKGRVRFVGAPAGAPFPSAVAVFGYRTVVDKELGEFDGQRVTPWDWRPQVAAMTTVSTSHAAPHPRDAQAPRKGKQ